MYLMIKPCDKEKGSYLSSQMTAEVEQSSFPLMSEDIIMANFTYCTWKNFAVSKTDNPKSIPNKLAFINYPKSREMFYWKLHFLKHCIIKLMSILINKLCEVKYLGFFLQ